MSPDTIERRRKQRRRRPRLPRQPHQNRAVRHRAHPRRRTPREAPLPVLPLVRRGNELPHRRPRLQRHLLRPPLLGRSPGHRPRRRDLLGGNGIPVGHGSPAGRSPADAGPGAARIHRQPVPGGLRERVCRHRVGRRDRHPRRPGHRAADRYSVLGLLPDPHGHPARGGRRRIQPDPLPAAHPVLRPGCRLRLHHHRGSGQRQSR